MLDAFDRAKEQTQGDRVKVFHGNLGEAEFRKWLARFLPRKFGVTSGFIVSQRAPETRPLPHYDVIIYDRMESPVLWVRDSPDASEQGSARAIPVEFVKGVLEVKSAFNHKSASDALDHLSELDSFLSNEDVPNERYPSFLPKSFFRTSIFFELRDRDRTDFAALKEALRTVGKRGYFDPLILRGEGLDKHDTGVITVCRSMNRPPERFGPVGGDIISGHAISDCEFMFGSYYGAILDFSPISFSRYAFDLVALMNGTYKRGRLSSLHASVGPWDA